ncbi:MAG: hypothetical protein ACI9XU_000986 [Arenicella sp.]|jgi:hypothetical protein
MLHTPSNELEGKRKSEPDTIFILVTRLIVPMNAHSAGGSNQGILATREKQ